MTMSATINDEDLKLWEGPHFPCVSLFLESCPPRQGDRMKKCGMSSHPQSQEDLTIVEEKQLVWSLSPLLVTFQSSLLIAVGWKKVKSDNF